MKTYIGKLKWKKISLKKKSDKVFWFAQKGRQAELPGITKFDVLRFISFSNQGRKRLSKVIRDKIKNKPELMQFCFISGYQQYPGYQQYKMQFWNTPFPESK